MVSRFPSPRCRRGVSLLGRSLCAVLVALFCPLVLSVGFGSRCLVFGPLPRPLLVLALGQLAVCSALVRCSRCGRFPRSAFSCTRCRLDLHSEDTKRRGIPPATPLQDPDVQAALFAWVLHRFSPPKKVGFFMGRERPLKKQGLENALRDTLYTIGTCRANSRHVPAPAGFHLTAVHLPGYNPLRVGGLRLRQPGCRRPVVVSFLEGGIDTLHQCPLQYALMSAPWRRHTDVGSLMPCPGGLGPDIRNRGRQRCLTYVELRTFSHNP